MIRKETVLFEVEKIAAVIAKILGLKQQGNIEEAFELSETALVEYFRLPVEELADLTPEQLIGILKTKGYISEKLDLLAQLIFENAHPFQDTPATINKLHLVLAIFGYMETEHHVQSLNNLAKREMIDKFLNNQQYE